MKYLTFINTCWLIVLTVWVLVTYSLIETSVETVEETKKEIEMYVNQKPDTIVININNYLNKK